MRPSGNLAGVEFVDVPLNTYTDTRETWREIISESGYWFTKSAIRYFNCRVAWQTLTPIPGGYLFISSEQQDAVPGFPATYWQPRLYTLRTWTLENGVGTIGEFQGHETMADAKRALKNAKLSADVAEFLNQDNQLTK